MNCGISSVAEGIIIAASTKENTTFRPLNFSLAKANAAMEQVSIVPNTLNTTMNAELHIHLAKGRSVMIST